MKINPTQNRVVVKLAAQETVSPMGIIIAGAPDTAFDRGVIVEVGPGIKTPTGELIPLDFKVGETVLFKNFSGQQVSVKGLQFLILSENDIIAVLED